MSRDIRVAIEFFDHPKTIALEDACGEVAPLRLIELWAKLAAVRPRGNLDGLSPARIERMAGWQGEPGAFLAQLKEPIRGYGAWVDVDAQGNAVSMHDWREHQPYVATADVRSEIARKAAEARWGKKQGSAAHGIAERNAKGNAKRNASSNAPAPAPPPAPNSRGGAAAPPALEGAEGQPPQDDEPERTDPYADLGYGPPGEPPPPPPDPTETTARLERCSRCGGAALALTPDDGLCMRCAR